MTIGNLQQKFFVYILQCSDNSLYVGSTNNMEKRLREHNASKNGAHYTKIRRPVTLVYKEEMDSYKDARAREAEIKRFKREQKINLIHMKQTKKESEENKSFKHPLILVLDNVRSVQNVASIFRIADCVGVSKVILGGITPGPLDRFKHQRKDFIKVSLGSEHSVVWEHCDDVVKKIKSYKKEGFEIVALEQTKNSISYKNFSISKPTILILGTEVDGVSKKIITIADTCIEIEMAGKKESLNVAIASAVALFKLRDF